MKKADKTMAKPNWQRALIISAPLLIVAFLAIFVMNQQGFGSKPNAPTNYEPIKGYGTEFSLLDQDNQERTQNIFNGTYSLVFFGFTYCPDVCPMTLQTLEEVIKDLGPKVKKVQIVFITLDPERDDAATLKAYLSSRGFPNGVIGLTGSRSEIDKVAKAYRVSYEKVGEGDNYVYNHSSVIYLLNKKGEFIMPLSHGLKIKDQTALIKNAMDKNA
jgi:protein SCO1